MAEADVPGVTRDDLARTLDIGGRVTLVETLTDGLVGSLPFEDYELDAIKALPNSLRIPLTVRLQEALDNLRDVVATVAFAVIDLGLDQTD